MNMRWSVVCLAALAMTAGNAVWTELAANGVQLTRAQAPTGNAVSVTADNFNRAEADMYFGKIVKGGGIGSLSHRRELYLTDSPVVRPNRDTLYSLGVFDFDAGPVIITLPDAGNRFFRFAVIGRDR